MKKTLFVLAAVVLVASMVLTACGPKETATEPVVEPTEVVTESPTEEPVAEKVQIRWFVGLGTGTDPAQIEVEQALVDKFNESHDNIELVLEVVPFDSAKDTLATQIAAGTGPDVIGPVGWGGSNAFYGQWLELSPYLSGFDSSTIDPALIDMYSDEEEGQLGLPFLVFPAAVWYMPALFEEAGLNMLPTEWGGNYVMPDGTEVVWDYAAMTTVAQMLTLDINGKNALEEGFDKTQIVQYGFHPTWSGHPAYLGAYQGTPAFFEGTAGAYTATIPDSWKGAWKWYYNGIWGDKPFIPNAQVAGSPEFGSGNTFNSGKVAMTMTNLWYTCCAADFAAAGYEFQFAPVPVGSDGMPHSRVDADTFRLWKGTPHPAEAFEVLAYLIGPIGTEYLVVSGTTGTNAAYGGFPALPEFQQAFLDAKAVQYPFVTTWDVILGGLAYPDVPSAEGYQPNWNEAWARMQTFGDLMGNTAGLDLDVEIATLETDLTTIYNK